METRLFWRVFRNELVFSDFIENMVKFICMLLKGVTIWNVMIAFFLFILMRTLAWLVSIPSKIDFLINGSDYVFLEKEISSWKYANIKMITPDFVSFYPYSRDNTCYFSSGPCPTALQAYWGLMSDLWVSYIERYPYIEGGAPYWLSYDQIMETSVRGNGAMKVNIRKEGALAWLFWTSYFVFPENIVTNSADGEFKHGRMSCKKLEETWAVCTDP